jgi:hypothetical protein
LAAQIVKAKWIFKAGTLLSFKEASSPRTVAAGGRKQEALMSNGISKGRTARSSRERPHIPALGSQ